MLNKDVIHDILFGEDNVLKFELEQALTNYLVYHLADYDSYKDLPYIDRQIIPEFIFNTIKK